MKPVLVAGELNVDLILTGVDGLPVFGGEILAQGLCKTPGSSSMICSMGLAKLGTAVRFVGRVGDDERGRYCVDALHRAGIDTAGVIVDDTLETGLTVALSSERDRALVTYPGAIAALAADDVTDAALQGASHLHVSSYFLQRRLRDGLPHLIARARLAGLSVSLDPGYDPDDMWGTDIGEVLPLLDVFLPNEVEACAIAGTDHVDDALRVLSGMCQTVVVKTGAKGCIGIDGEGIVRRVSAFLVQAVDTTGAGDSFDAGFLHAWLAHRPLDECMRWGAACGALSTRALGGTPAQADTAEVRAMLEGIAA
ncbi:MAG: putative sugar kinase YdjH [Luteibacter sp.]|uniref:carbohydrate kinase family protein n=1 Tax=Luteibacter sp. TaxID=1886636 RepID=UPI00137EFD98|nr:carbohydrate kinase family protein [Luteibacter sp.]KAF1005156.1 MAG: putative sugar kinase YdjH [Luteibacter sp.]